MADYDSQADALRRLERAEEQYLFAAGWQARGGWWSHPRAPGSHHVARVAAYKQRQIDATERSKRNRAEEPRR